MLGVTPEGGFRVPITREPSVNERPKTEEVPAGPDAYAGLLALGDLLHKTARPAIERVLTGLQRERRREIVDLGRHDPDKLNMALIEDAEAGIDEGLEGAAELTEHTAILEERVAGRTAIIAELEKAGTED